MGLFNRKKSTDGDINDYYASERRQRIGMAWALGIATLLLTLVLALGLFYGGRWAYRAAFEDDETTTSEVSTEQNQSDDNQAGSGSDDEPQDNEDIAQSGDRPGQQNDDTEAIIGSDTQEGDNGPAANTNENQSSQSSEEDLPNSGAQELPSTGPENVFAVFAATTILAGLAHKLLHAKLNG